MKKRLFVMLAIQINRLFVMVKRMSQHSYVEHRMVNNRSSEDRMTIMITHLSDMLTVRFLMKLSFDVQTEVQITKKPSFDVLMVRIITLFKHQCTDRPEISCIIELSLCLLILIICFLFNISFYLQFSNSFLYNINK